MHLPWRYCTKVNFMEVFSFVFMKKKREEKAIHLSVRFFTMKDTSKDMLILLPVKVLYCNTLVTMIISCFCFHCFIEAWKLYNIRTFQVLWWRACASVIKHLMGISSNNLLSEYSLLFLLLHCSLSEILYGESVNTIVWKIFVLKTFVCKMFVLKNFCDLR